MAMGSETAIAAAGHRPFSSVPHTGGDGLLAVRSAPVRDVPFSLRAEWQALAADAAEPNCFNEPWFVAAGLKHLAGDEVRLIEVRSAMPREPLIGVLPVHIGADYGRMRVSHVRNWKHHHDFLAAPLIRHGYEGAFWCAVLRHLDAADWAPGFLHVNGLVEGGPVHHGLELAAGAHDREAAVVHRMERALLQSELGAEAYYETQVRKKKRKELKRLRNRLEELGPVALHALGPREAFEPWCDAFLSLEKRGWKGRARSALASRPETAAFFRDALAGARAAGRLEMLRLDLGDRPIAMLVNFLAAPGAFSFKIAFDEEFARFSPGVLIELENLRILDRPDIAWMDSCAAEKHNMIDSLWGGRRAIVRVSVPLSGLQRAATYRLCRTLEQASAARRAFLSQVKEALA